jgi:hypothetical protein
MGFARRVAAVARDIPLWVFIALFLIGVVSIVMFENSIQNEVFARYMEQVKTFDTTPYGGIYWIINVYGVDRVLLRGSGPLTTTETYIFDVQPKGVKDARFCSTTPIRSIEMELIGAAFTIVPPDPQSRPIEDYCGGRSIQSTPILTWEVLAKQAGHHVAALRIVGLDSQKQPVDDATFEVPIVVKDPGSLISIGTIVAVLGAIGTALSLWDRFRAPNSSSK